MVNFAEVQRAQLAKSTLLTSSLVPLGSFSACSDAKESYWTFSNKQISETIFPNTLWYEMNEAFMAGVMIFIEQFRARSPWSIGVLES